MPTITFSLKDLQNLVGKKLTIEEIQDLAHYGKGDFEGYDKETDEVKIDFGDTNLPYLWSVEGFARLINQILGKQKGISALSISKGNYKVIVDRSVSNVRPHISSFVAKGQKISEYLLKQIIQLQEKLCDNYGRRRQKVAIGVYQYNKIDFPVYYRATEPESVKFTPLDFKKDMTQQEILEEHPKGKDYAWILEGCKKYPILMDDKGEILSFPPIINSEKTGKIQEGDSELFFEATGTDENSVLLATNIFAQALSERGFKIYSVDIISPSKKMTTPFIFNEKIKINKEQIKKITGLDLKDVEIKKYLEKAGYDVIKGNITIPHYRRDILHNVDIIEDILIMYGYNNIEECTLKSYTIGSTNDIIVFIDKVREILIGAGYQEVMSPILSNKNILNNKMNIEGSATIEIENFMSETYSAVRSWLLPILIDFLSKNKHVEYPQNIFEQGIVTTKKGELISDYERMAVASVNEKSDYTGIKQILDYLFRMLGIKYTIVEVEHDSFIKGRVGRVIVNDKKVAFIGEVSPIVLNNSGIDLPVAAFELNLTDLFHELNKSKKG
ncbi:MAG: phenylalanine--tRNA ligase subunit beta [Nanoarchaeota archaeon]